MTLQGEFNLCAHFWPFSFDTPLSRSKLDKQIKKTKK